MPPRKRTAAAGIHVVLGGPTSERQVSRQSGCFVGLSLLASGNDVRFHLMDLQSRYTEIGLFYVLHHDVEEIQALVTDPGRRATIEAVGRAVRSEFAMADGPADAALAMGHPTSLAAAVDDADFVFLALHGGPGEDGRLQLALERLGRPYNGSGPRAADVAGDKAVTAARVRTLGLPGVDAPAQRQVDVFELGEWLEEMGAPGAAAARYRDLCDEVGADVLVCKPAADGCSTGVKILKHPEVMARFFDAVVSELPEFVGDEARADLRGRTPSIAMPVPAPKRWLVERAFVEPVAVELPPGDLNLESLRPWFEAKRYVELTAAVLDRSGRGLVAAVPSVTVAADELTLQQKFQQGVGTNLALDLFVSDAEAESVRHRVEAVARAFGIEGYARLDVFWDRQDDVVFLLEINSLCGLTEATVFYSQWLADGDSAPPWAVLDRIVAAGLERFDRVCHGGSPQPRRPSDGQDPAPMIRLDDLVVANPGLEVRGDPHEGRYTRFCFDSRLVEDGDLFVAVRTQRATGTTTPPRPSPAGPAPPWSTTRPPCPTACPSWWPTTPSWPWSATAPTWCGRGVRGWWRSPARSARRAPRNWWPMSSPPGTPCSARPATTAVASAWPWRWAGSGPEHEVAVIEMATGHFGEIDAMCAMAPPEVGVVTAVGAAHLVALGDVEGVAREKGALLTHLPPDGLAVVDADDPRAVALASRSAAPVVSVGTSADAGYRAEDVVVGGRRDVGGVRPTTGGGWRSGPVARGPHRAGRPGRPGRGRPLRRRPRRRRRRAWAGVAGVPGRLRSLPGRSRRASSSTTRTTPLPGRSTPDSTRWPRLPAGTGWRYWVTWRSWARPPRSCTATSAAMPPRSSTCW